MKKKRLKIAWVSMVIFALLFTRADLLAKPVTFRNAGLSFDTVVKLDVTGKTATGTYFIQGQSGEANEPAMPFTGKVIPTPKGKRGVYLEIHFAAKPPYDVPPGGKPLVWHLTIVEHRAHLFIPIHGRNYMTQPATRQVYDIELEPEDE